MKTPDEEVAEKVLQRFRENDLLTEKCVQKIGKSLAQGALSAEDWRLIFEMDLSVKEGTNASESQKD